eukprot:COSAG02_NODE_17_length_55377_cov_106.402258_28_plen_310_part_00
MRARCALLIGWTLLVGAIGLHFVLDDPTKRDERFLRQWTGRPLTRGRHVAALFELLCASVDLLERESIEYWIEAGALMGSQRDGALIPWDGDLDIGMTDSGVDRLQRITRAEVGRFLASWVRLEVAGSTEHPTSKHHVSHSIVARFIDTRTGVYIDVFRYFPLGFNSDLVEPTNVAKWLASPDEAKRLTRGYTRLSRRGCVSCEARETITDIEKKRGVTKPITRYRPLIPPDVFFPLGNCSLAATIGGTSREFRCATKPIANRFSIRGNLSHSVDVWQTRPTTVAKQTCFVVDMQVSSFALSVVALLLW